MEELLKVKNISKRFGGIVAVKDVSFEIYEGETLGFIGPNGAGKSTVVNLLSGLFPADSGEIILKGVDITKMKPYQRAHLGMARTYQIPRPFPELTALASVATSALCGKKRRNQSFEDAAVEATHYLEFVGLFSKRNILARDLTFYELRMRILPRRGDVVRDGVIRIDDAHRTNLRALDAGKLLALLRPDDDFDQAQSRHNAQNRTDRAEISAP